MSAREEIDPESQADPQLHQTVVRPVRTADIQLSDSDGFGVYVDVRVTTCPKNEQVPAWLSAQERHKRAECGQGPHATSGVKDGAETFHYPQSLRHWHLQPAAACQGSPLETAQWRQLVFF